MCRRSRSLVLAALALALAVGGGMLISPEAATAEGASSEEPGAPEPDDRAFEAEEADAAAAGCDAAAGGEAAASASDVAELLADEAPDRTIPTPEPTEWRANRGRQCRRYHGRAFCDGPRRVPEPHGAAAELAARLGLDDERRVGRIALSTEPEAAWMAAIDGETGPGLLWPVPEGRLWRGFGRHRVLVRRRGRMRRGRRQRMHRGVDIGAEEGSAIRAVNDGLVLYSNNGMRGYGNSVVLLHPDGTVTLYAHCRATYVFAGQQVERGQVVGEVGHTGLAHGPHLHFEWRAAGRPRDPLPHFVGREDETGGPSEAQAQL